jgi:hypothetical protein
MNHRFLKLVSILWRVVAGLWRGRVIWLQDIFTILNACMEP